jgi:putative ABC transport system permease protein
MIRRLFREIGRAPVRILTSVMALALAIGAIGVLAIPTVSTKSLRDAAQADGIPQVIVPVDDSRTFDVASIVGSVDNVDRAEAQILTFVHLGDGRAIDVLGVDLGQQELDIVRADEGRLPSALGEVLVTDGVAQIGDNFEISLPGERSGQEVVGTMTASVVGIGGTAFWNEDDVVFTSLESASAIAGLDGANRVVVRTTDMSADALRETSKALRTTLAESGVTTTSLPFTIPDGRHPIEADIEQISMLVGLLGIVAGLVALVLLASTVNTLITERTREVAVMRALGAPNRLMRRRLRRLALSIASAAVLLGVPLGIVISNFIARMILNEFVGLTPGFAVSIPVMVGSAVFALVGARLVAARAARRVTGRPLAEALRDRSGSPFGRRLSERLSARIRVGALLDRTALRNGVHQRARSFAMFAQITAAVAALLIVASLATTVTDYNAALIEPVQWGSRTLVPGPGLDIDASLADSDPRSEVGTDIEGELSGWEIDVKGFATDTKMIDLAMDSGRWFAAPGEAAISTGFAQRINVGIGDEIEVDLASGTHSYTVVGLHPDRDRSVFVDTAELAINMNRPGMGNVVMSLDNEPPPYMSGVLSVERLSDISDDDSGTDAILLIFAAIGAIVVAVAGLAVASGLAVGVYERRHQFAALRAIGGRRRHAFRVVVAELLPLGVAGIGAGLVAGWFGSAAIMESFEASNAIEIGYTFATGAIPIAVGVVLIGSLLLGGLMVRRVTRQPVAVSLRGAA